MRYEKYKQTGTKWITSIPVSWDMQKIGALFVQRKEKVSDKDFAPISVTKNGILPQLATAAKTDDGDNRKKVCVGDFVINSRSDRKGSCGVSDLEGSVSLINIVLQPREQLSGKYAHYLLRNHLFSEEYYRNGRGIVADLWTTRYSEMKTILLPVPPHAEQDQIVRYLDWQVSKINRLIAAKRKEIVLLKEHRTAKINQAVTTGIHSDTQLAYTGYNWLPYAPANWKPVPAKALFRNITELRRLDDSMLAATQKYGLIEQTEYMRLEGRRIVLANDNLDKWLHTEPNDFIISLRSFQGGLEMCSKPGCVTWHYVVLRAQRDVYPDFYKWFFKSAAYVGALQKTSDFIRDGQDLRFSNFIKVGLFIIPMDEQREIAEYLNREIPKYDVAISNLEKQIDQITELRTRLISDVVTGQVDVRGIKVPDDEYINNEITEEEFEEESENNEEE